MTPITQNVADQYVQKVMSLIHAPAADRTRIEADLQAHLQEGLAEGEDMLTLVERMGDPRDVAAEFMTQIPLVYAGFWRRLAAFLIDMVLIVLFAGLGGGLFVVVSNSVPQHPTTTWENFWGTILILLAVISANACIAMILAYFPLLEARFVQRMACRSGPNRQSFADSLSTLKSFPSMRFSFFSTKSIKGASISWRAPL
jgi:hypothetical protein